MTITYADVVELKVTNPDVAAAMRQFRAERNGPMRRQFGDQDQGDYLALRYVGLLGQVVASRFYGADPFAGACVDHDAEAGGRTVDFKTAKTDRAVPDLDALVLVRADLPAVQRPDAYVSIEVNTFAGRAWLYGWVARRDYLRRARLVRVGGRPAGRRFNGFRARFADTLALPHRQLNPAGGLAP